MKKMIFAIALCVSSFAFAHEGHDHDAPGARALKGGQVQRIEVVHVEVVPHGNSVRIYLLDLNSTKAKSLDFKEFDISAKAELPRGKGTVPLQLEAKDGYYEANVDAKGQHRYTLVLSLNHKPTKHADTLSFVIEPKK
jgi:hypothetical protein